MQDRVRINFEQCNALVELIRRRTLPVAEEDMADLGITEKLLPNFLFLAVAICHQTTPRAGPALRGVVDGVTFRGWDYLIQSLRRSVLNNSHLLSPQYWAEMTDGDFRDVFSDDLGSFSFSEPNERLDLIHDLGKTMFSRNLASVNDIYKRAAGYVKTDHGGILDELSVFKAYRDPVSKKSFFFLELMTVYDVWKVKDPENIGAPVDYHEIRGHLRIGTVEVVDLQLRNKIAHDAPLNEEEDVLIRTNVQEVLGYLKSELQMINEAPLHYFFWNIFRNICRRVEPLCFDSEADGTLPKRYQDYLSILNPGGCPFRGFCRSAGEIKPIPDYVADVDYY